MATKPQGFPSDAPLIDSPSGTLSLPWIQFFITLWNRTGAGNGNLSADFNYPTTPGSPLQVLTSEGINKPTIWTTVLTKLSQFQNDVGYITSAALEGLASTSDLPKGSTATPQVETTNGSVGFSQNYARGDHAHPRETSPNFGGNVTANKFIVNSATWTAGQGQPSGSQPAGSLYSNTTGGIGARLFVSNGSTWTAVTGV